MRATISAVILTKNEAHQIRHCLDALAWVDEIVVVDGESTDGTPDICREYRATVVTRRLAGHFGQQRNSGTAQTTKDWVLHLDADEVVTDEFRRAVEQALSNGNAYAAYQFLRKNYFLGHWMRYGGWHHYTLHLFRRGKAQYEGRVHERLVVEGPVGVLEAAVEHYPFTSLSRFLERQNMYTGLAALEVFEQRGHVSPRELRYHLLVKPIKLFWKMYLKKQGFREGMYGLVFAGLYSFIHFLKWAKVWELQNARSHNIEVDNPYGKVYNHGNNEGGHP